MQVAVFSTRRYAKTRPLRAKHDAVHELRFLQDRLTAATAPLAAGCAAVCVFVNDRADAEVCHPGAAGHAAGRHALDRLQPDRHHVIQRPVSFPKVIVTGRQAFFSDEAIGQIMQTSIASISAFERGEALAHRVPAATPAA